VGEGLKKRLRQTRFEGAVHEATLNLLVAAGHVQGLLDRALERHGVTTAQFNVLRILRGARPDGFPRCEIARRMVERAPDVTRLIDRLATQGLVERVRSESDRRLSLTRITRKGLEALERIQPDFEAVHRSLAGRLGAKDARELSRLCEALYEGEEIEP
jgi:DNA-binding MarR family transcriptional regulator